MENRDKVRLLITDTNREKEIFTNYEIDTFLDMEDDDVHYAAALAMETIANSEALTLKVISLLDLKTDGAKLADSLRDGADRMRARSDNEEEDFDIYEVYEDDDEGEESE
jgi:hypothetical protein